MSPGGPSPIMTGLVLCMSAIYNRGKESFFIYRNNTFTKCTDILVVCKRKREREREVKLQIVVNEKPAVRLGFLNI